MFISTNLAVIFDFDDTLVPDSSTLFFKKYNVDARSFWETDLKRLIQKGYDPSLGFIKLLLDKIGPTKPFGNLTNADLNKFGAELDAHYYPGIPEIFGDLRTIVNRYKFSIDFYIISGGLQEIITGSKVVQENFTAVYGCQLEEAGKPPRLKYIKKVISFTEKTRFLFEINKGITPDISTKNPYAVNRDIPRDERQVPFPNMVYVGDGLTDIPCFSTLSQYGGTPFGVFDPHNPAKAKRALIDFLKTNRVVSMHSPNYMDGAELGTFLRAAVSNICNRIAVAFETANRKFSES